MTHWDESCDNQKDAWHWLGLAISLAYRIGLNNDTSNSNMETHRKKLWKRIWWSCLIQDRLVALAMRRPVRVKDEDYNVSMLTEDDFEIQAICESNNIIPQECSLARDIEMQKDLVQVCIAKAKLCLCVSSILDTKYSILVTHQGLKDQEHSIGSFLMPGHGKICQEDEIRRCDNGLSKWLAELPGCCSHISEMPFGSSGPPLLLHRSLLHMVYFTALSELHHTQIFPPASNSQPGQSRELQELTRKRLQEVYREITRMSQDLHCHSLEEYLPDTIVTTILQTIITHLHQGILLIGRLGNNYTPSDFTTQTSETAAWKAAIDVVIGAFGDKSCHDYVETNLMSEKSSNSDHLTPLLGRDIVVKDMTLDPQSPGMIDVCIPTERLSENGFLKAISAYTPPDFDYSCNGSSIHMSQPSTIGLGSSLNGGIDSIDDDHVEFNHLLDFYGTTNELQNRGAR